MQQRQRKSREAQRRAQRRRRKRRALFRALLLVTAAACLIGVVKGLRQPRQESAPEPGDANTALSGKNESGTDKEAWIRSHPDQYPDFMVQLLDRYPETLPFVYDYPKAKDKEVSIDLSDEVTRGTVPLFLQWDERWGYREYGNDLMAITGCGPTCLSMVLCALTGDADWSPWAVAQYADKNGYYVEGTGTAWALMSQGAAELGLSAEEMSLSESGIRERLSMGQPIICSMGPGDFTTAGHFVVLSGLNDDGTIQIRDTNSPKNSDQSWELSRLMNQMRNLWAYTVV